ncbi:hypothetical protein CHUV2995_02054 [Corynebacterium diphtheriae subsp. lausannense]|nr:hypothetical protein FRC0043_02542 [Corynebacterium belfantii]SPJ41242.1 hypothetical protein CHUV2995_02054 [Corynebacterium diphtheriae subsp. lausannense]
MVTTPQVLLQDTVIAPVVLFSGGTVLPITVQNCGDYTIKAVKLLE